LTGVGPGLWEGGRQSLGAWMVAARCAFFGGKLAEASCRLAADALEVLLIKMDIHKVLSLLPHRYPFLLVDRVVSFTPNEQLIGLKNVTFNEPYFTGHFPVRPVMPGVLIIEALAQATGLLAMESRPDEVGEKALYYFVGIDKARFKRPVEPGDQLFLDVQVRNVKRGIWRFSGEARVDERMVASADIMCTARDF
jgi:3-hydroxyacyl-[acyl-carrier-protein] dehydratase